MKTLAFLKQMIFPGRSMHKKLFDLEIANLRLQRQIDELQADRPTVIALQNRIHDLEAQLAKRWQV